MNPKKVAAIIPAAGSGIRMGMDSPKQFLELGDVPILVRTLRIFQQTDMVGHIIVVVPEAYCSRVEEMVRQYDLSKVKAVVAGGSERQDSVLAGLKILPDIVELVMVHDGVRPFVPVSVIENCLLEAENCGGAMAAIPVKDTLKAVSDRKVIKGTINRTGVWQAQTPQAATRKLIEEAYAEAARKNFVATDEAGLLELLGHPVKVVEGSELNIKITRSEDLVLAKAILMENGESMFTCAEYRIGHGYDAHRLAAGRSLILGGVEIPYEKGLLGHSDADVLTHAFCDALLGAIGAGDIGRHFPDTDKQFKDISSLKLLEKVQLLMDAKEYMLQSGDITVVAQKPRLSPYIEAMKENLAAVCRIDPDSINIKATTTEGLGFEGKEEGMSAHAVVLLKKTAS